MQGLCAQIHLRRSTVATLHFRHCHARFARLHRVGSRVLIIRPSGHSSRARSIGRACSRDSARVAARWSVGRVADATGRWLAIADRCCVAPLVCRAPGAARSGQYHGLIRDSSGRAYRAPPSSSSTRSTGAAVKPSATSRVVSRRRARARARIAWKQRWMDSNAPCAGSCSRPVRRRRSIVTLSPARITEVGDWSPPGASRKSAQEVPIPVSVVSGDARGRRRRLQREPPQGTHPYRPVLSRPIRATRRSTSAASARPSGSPTTASSPASASTSTARSSLGPRRRRSTFSTSSGSRCCADRRGRCSARTRRPARSTSRRASRASRPKPTSSSITATSDFVQAKASIGGPALSRRSRADCRSPAPRATARVYNATSPRGRPQRPQQSRASGVSCCSHRRTRSPSRSAAGLHASAPRGLCAGRRRRRPDAARPRIGSTPQIAADLGYTPPSFNAFDRLDRRRHAARGPTRILGGAVVDVRAGQLGAGPADVDHRLALLGLGSVERPRLHRAAGDHHLGQSIHAAAMDAGGPLRRRDCHAHLGLVVGAFAFQQTHRFAPLQARSRARRRRVSSWRRAPLAATPGLLDGYGQTVGYRVRRTSARRCSASSNGR